MKNVYHVSTKQHGDVKSGVLRSKNSTILQVRCASARQCTKLAKWLSFWIARRLISRPHVA